MHRHPLGSRASRESWAGRRRALARSCASSTTPTGSRPPRDSDVYESLNPEFEFVPFITHLAWSCARTTAGTSKTPTPTGSRPERDVRHSLGDVRHYLRDVRHLADAAHQVARRLRALKKGGLDAGRGRRGPLIADDCGALCCLIKGVGGGGPAIRLYLDVDVQDYLTISDRNLYRLKRPNLDITPLGYP